MQKRRAGKRKDTLFYCKVHDVETGEMIGHTVDLSTTGVRLLSTDVIEVGRTLSLRIELPEPMKGLDSLELRAETRWCRPDVNPDSMEAGLRFLDVPPAVHEILCALESMSSGCGVVFPVTR